MLFKLKGVKKLYLSFFLINYSLYRTWPPLVPTASVLPVGGWGHGSKSGRIRIRLRDCKSLAFYLQENIENKIIIWQQFFPSWFSNFLAILGACQRYPNSTCREKMFFRETYLELSPTLEQEFSNCCRVLGYLTMTFFGQKWHLRCLPSPCVQFSLWTLEVS